MRTRTTGQLKGKAAVPAAAEAFLCFQHLPLSRGRLQRFQANSRNLAESWAPVWLLFGDHTGVSLTQALAVPHSLSLW